MAEWVIRQQEKIVPKVAPPPPAPDPVFVAARKEEMDGFLQKGKEFIAQFPDFNETLDAASKRGLTMDNQAMVAIIRLRAPEVAYYLAKPENDATARKFMTMDGIQQVAEVGRIQERLAVHPNDFVSSAGRPGQRLNGNSNVDTRQPDQMDVDEYLKKRRADIKAGIRRR
jgi:hypothetical protein